MKSAPLAASRTALVSTATAASAPSDVDALPVVVDDRERPGDRRVAQPALRVDALAEPGHRRGALDLRERAVRDVRDEQPRGVGPDVDDGDAHARQPAG